MMISDNIYYIWSKCLKGQVLYYYIIYYYNATSIFFKCWMHTCHYHHHHLDILLSNIAKYVCIQPNAILSTHLPSNNMYVVAIIIAAEKVAEYCLTSMPETIYYNQLDTLQINETNPLCLIASSARY